MGEKFGSIRIDVVGASPIHYRLSVSSMIIVLQVDMAAPYYGSRGHLTHKFAIVLS